MVAEIILTNLPVKESINSLNRLKGQDRPSALPIHLQLDPKLKYASQNLLERTMRPANRPVGRIATTT